jgi:hypothetical protein
MSPSPPSHQVGNEKEYLEEHIGVKLNLVEEKKEKRYIDQTQRPAPDFGSRS